MNQQPRLPHQPLSPLGIQVPASRCGAARIPLELPRGIPMAGYSIMGKRGRKGTNRLFARAIYLEDSRGHVAAICVVDLMSASHYLLARSAEILGGQGLALDESNIVLSGTHTHTGPGHYFHNGLFDTYASKSMTRQFDRRITESMAQSIALAITQACHKAIPARVKVDIRKLWGASNSRSLESFKANPLAARWNEPGMPGATSLDLTETQKAVDPRVVVLSAWDARNDLIAAFATFGCHNTATGPKTRFYDPDWTGRAAILLERHYASRRRKPVVAVGMGASGDVSPLPMDNDGKREHSLDQGPALAAFVGTRVFQAMLEACESSTRPLDIRLRCHYQEWRPAEVIRKQRRGDPIESALPPLAHWCMGAPALGGAEDGRSYLHPLAPEGMTGSHFPPRHPQHPKQIALGLFGYVINMLRGVSPSSVHPLHLLRIQDHVFATVPGEPTVMTAHQIQESLLRLLPVESASVIGYAGDYAGYFTTTHEYLKQAYEGASTIYGRYTVPHLVARIGIMARSDAQAPRLPQRRSA